MRRFAILLIMALVGCGEGVPPAPPPIIVTPAMYLATGVLAEVQEGQVVDLDPDLVPSMNFVMWVGVSATQLSTETVTVTGRLKRGALILTERSRSMTFTPSMEAPGVFVPMPLNISTVLGMPTCPVGVPVDVENRELTLEVEITEPLGRQGVGSRGVVPACRRINGKEQIRCHMACSSGH